MPIQLTGSLNISGSNTLIGTKTITGSVFISGSKTVIGTNTITGSMLISGSINTNGTITATTLVVQTITSSISSITGSTNFGSLSSNTHTFTGSLNVSGSGNFSGSVDGTIINSTSNVFRLNGNNAVSLVTLNSQSVVKINAAGFWGVQLVGANDSGIVINNTGNVGIGTTSPGQKLHIVASSNPYIRIDDTSVNSEGGLIMQPTGYNAKGGLTLNFSNGEFKMFTGETGNSYFQTFYTNGLERMRISSTGTVAIGGATHTFIDYTTNTARFYGGSSTNTFGLGAASAIYYQGDASQFYPTADNTRSLGTASYRYTAVYATSGTVNSSDLKQKKNIAKSDLGIDFINKLNPVKYNWIEGDTKTHYGLIAQEIESLNIDNFGALYIEDDKYGLNYSEFIAPMIKAIQELTARVQYLENK
jgi:hypothetical protein